ncbi:MAG: O-antigen/teichoic acid export membrane protein [Alteromonadaceae bacterium]
MKLFGVTFSLQLFSYIGSNLLVKFFVFGSQLFVATILSPVELGEVKTALSIIEISSLFACLGLNASLLATAPKLESKSERNNIYLLNLLLTFISSIVVAILLFSLSKNNFIFDSSNTNVLISKFSVLLILTSLTTQLVCILQSEQQFFRLARSQIYTKLLSISIIIFSTFYFGINGYVSSLYISAILTFIVLLYVSKIKISINNLTTSWSIKEICSQWNIAKNSLFSNVVGTFSFYSGLIILNLIVDIENSNIIGLYSFSLIIITGFDIISRSVQQYFIPRFSKQSCDGKLLVLKYEKIFFSIAFLIYLLSCLFLFSFQYLLPEFKYIKSMDFLYLMMLGWVFSIFSVMKAGYFISSGQTIFNFKSSIANLFLTVTLGYLFSVNFGVWGLITSRVITSVLLSMVYSYYFARSK